MKKILSFVAISAIFSFAAFAQTVTTSGTTPQPSIVISSTDTTQPVATADTVAHVVKKQCAGEGTPKCKTSTGCCKGKAGHASTGSTTEPTSNTTSTTTTQPTTTTTTQPTTTNSKCGSKKNCCKNKTGQATTGS